MTGLYYCKRYRMERDLRLPLPAAPRLPEGYWFIPWDDGLLARHAEVKVAAFQDQVDSTVFPCLATFHGCRKLMEAIRFRPGFVPGATWLIACGIDYCGTVQGVRDVHGLGAIQNVGVTPGHRGQGLGRALMLQALAGFLAVGVRRAMLEVTSNNSVAVELYRQLGFQCRRSVYKPLVAVSRPVAELAAAR